LKPGKPSAVPGAGPDRDPHREEKLAIIAAVLMAVRVFRGAYGNSMSDADAQTARERMAAQSANDAVALLAAVEKVGL
jgi:hypothetical protein